MAVLHRLESAPGYFPRPKAKGIQLLTNQEPDMRAFTLIAVEMAVLCRAVKDKGSQRLGRMPMP